MKSPRSRVKIGKRTPAMLAALISIFSLPSPVSAGEKSILFWKKKPALGTGSRYTPRVQPRVRQADEAALRGSMATADGLYAVAVKEFTLAVKVLPKAPLTEERRKIYTKRLKEVTEKLLEQKKQTGPKAAETTAKQSDRPGDSTGVVEGQHGPGGPCHSKITTPD